MFGLTPRSPTIDSLTATRITAKSTAMKNCAVRAELAVRFIPLMLPLAKSSETNLIIASPNEKSKNVTYASTLVRITYRPKPSKVSFETMKGVIRILTTISANQLEAFKMEFLRILDGFAMHYSSEFEILLVKPILFVKPNRRCKVFYKTKVLSAM
jgi:hypothetical protein